MTPGFSENRLPRQPYRAQRMLKKVEPIGYREENPKLALNFIYFCTGGLG
jgi:hypothetical protein